MTEYEFKSDAVREAFSNIPVLSARLNEADVTPEELAGYLNEQFDQSDRQMIAAMFTDHDITFEFGEIRIRERHDFETWKEETGWEAPDGPTD